MSRCVQCFELLTASLIINVSNTLIWCQALEYMLSTNLLTTATFWIYRARISVGQQINQSMGHVSLSVFLSVSPTVCLSISRRPTIQPSSQSVCLPTGAHQPVSLFLSEVSQSASLSTNQLINQSGCLPVYTHQPVCLSVCG